MSEVMKVKNGNGNSQQCQMPHKDTEKIFTGFNILKIIIL